MLAAMEENKADYNKYYEKDECTLILRILKLINYGKCDF